MKRLRIPILTDLTLPTSFNDETWDLFVVHKNGTHIPSIPRKEQCENEGGKFMNRANKDNRREFRPAVSGYIGIKGKKVGFLLI